MSNAEDIFVGFSPTYENRINFMAKISHEYKQYHDSSQLDDSGYYKDHLIYSDKGYDILFIQTSQLKLLVFGIIFGLGIWPFNSVSTGSSETVSRIFASLVSLILTIFSITFLSIYIYSYVEYLKGIRGRVDIVYLLSEHDSEMLLADIQINFEQEDQVNSLEVKNDLTGDLGDVHYRILQLGQIRKLSYTSPFHVQISKQKITLQLKDNGSSFFNMKMGRAIVIFLK